MASVSLAKTALALGLVLTTACASPSPVPAVLPPVWAVGPDRLLELDPEAEIRTNILPMYGGTDRAANQVADMADKQFIEQTSAEFGGRVEASKRYAEQGLKFYDADNYEKAMMRLNQAWLLDETNPDVFYGFAAVYQDHNNHLEAGDFAATSLELGQKDPKRLVNCAFLLARQAVARTQVEGTPSDAEVERIQAKLRPLIDRALTSAPPEDLAFVQLMAFRIQMRVLDYDEAWRSFDALEAMGESVPDLSRQALEKQPRPERR